MGEFNILFGYENNGTLYHITAVLDAFIGGSHAIDSNSLDAVLYRSHRSIADGVGVLRDSGDDVAGGEFGEYN